MTIILKEALNLNEEPVIDRAHRALQRQPGDNNPQQHLIIRIIRIHYWHTYEEILQKAVSSKDITFQGQRI